MTTPGKSGVRNVGGEKPVGVQRPVTRFGPLGLDVAFGHSLAALATTPAPCWRENEAPAIPFAGSCTKMESVSTSPG